MSTEVSKVEKEEQLPSLLGRSKNELVPTFMQGAPTEGTEQLGKFLTPPRLKVVQGQKTEQYKNFASGDVVMTPQGILVAHAGQPFWFVPLLFYPEWITVNPWEMRSQLPFIRERSKDVESEIARKARDPELRSKDLCPEDRSGKLFLRHVEVMTYVVTLVNNPDFAGIPMTVGFAKAEHKQGTNLAMLIKMRNAPLYGCVFQGVVPREERRNDKGAWYGIDVSNPTPIDGVKVPSPFVQLPEEFAVLQQLHRDLAQAARADLLRPDITDDDVDGAAVNAAGESQF